MAENSRRSGSARHHMRHYNAAADLIERNLAVRPEKIAYIDTAVTLLTNSPSA